MAHGEALIASAWEMPPGRYPGHDGLSMLEAALDGVLDHAPLPAEAIDGLLVCPSGMIAGAGADIFVHERLVSSLPGPLRLAATVNVGGATYAAMVARASDAIAAGRARAVLCLGAGHFPAVRRGVGAHMGAMVSDADLEVPAGAFIPAMYALTASALIATGEVRREDLAHVAVSSRAWALGHPDALMRDRGPLTTEQVLTAELVATPFGLLDCSVPCGGGGGVIVARRDMLAPQDAVVSILGIGEHHEHSSLVTAADIVSGGAATATAAAFEQAGFAPTDIDQWQVYDAFTSVPLAILPSAMGRARPEVVAAFREGRTAPGGDLPVNTNGGLLSFGHTGDASGLSMVVEAVHQLTAGAEHRGPAAETVYVHTYGGMLADHVALVLGRG